MAETSGESRVARRKMQKRSRPEERLHQRRVKRPRAQTVAIASAVIVIVAVVVVTAVAVNHSRDEARRVAAISATSSAGVASPYDLTELPSDTKLSVVEDSSFVSILIPNTDGRPISYGISADLSTGQALIDSVCDADEVDSESAVTTSNEPGGPADSKAMESTLTFVLPSRETLVFALDLDQGLIARAGHAWRPNGDLRALVEAAISTAP